MRPPEPRFSPDARLGTYRFISARARGDGRGLPRRGHEAASPGRAEDPARRLVAADPDRRERFEREAQAVAALNHPNIVTIHSVEEADGRLFLTMELVEGRTLGRGDPAGRPAAAKLLLDRRSRSPTPSAPRTSAASRTAT